MFSQEFEFCRKSTYFVPRKLGNVLSYVGFFIDLIFFLNSIVIVWPCPFDYNIETMSAKDSNSIPISQKYPRCIATISAGFEKGDFLVREEKGQRVYFDFFEEAFNYIAAKGYSRMPKSEEGEWMDLMVSIVLKCFNNSCGLLADYLECRRYRRRLGFWEG